jgi:hypothetical protein
MHEEAPPPIVRTRYIFKLFFILIKKRFILIRVIKVDRPLRSGYSQPGSPYDQSCNGLPSFSNGVMGANNPYRTHSILGSVGRPIAYQNAIDNDPSFSSASSFEYAPQASMAPAASQQTMMMMPPSQQVQPMSYMQPQQPVQAMSYMQPQQQVQAMSYMQPQQQVQPMGVMSPQQSVQHMGVMQQQPGQQQYMYRPVHMQSSMPQMVPQSASQFPLNYVSQNYMYPTHPGMSFGYRPMMQQGRMISSGMPMMAAGNTLGTPANSFPSQPAMFNPLAQQLVY